METPFFSHGGSLMNLGIIVGAFLASLAASQFKIRKIKSVRQVIAAIVGGLLMGYGTRVAFGCNIGLSLVVLPHSRCTVGFMGSYLCGSMDRQ